MAPKVESLCAMMAWCFHAPSGDLDPDADLRMTREQQQQHQQRHKLPWFLGGPPDKPITNSKYGSVGSGMIVPTSAEKDRALSTLQVRTTIVPANALPPRWVHDESVLQCEDEDCQQVFDLLVRKHHCRACGRVFCADCTIETERVLKYGFTDPVRVCHECAREARAENELYETHLPLLEQGDVFLKRGLLRRRLVELKFVRNTLIFQYQTVDPELRVVTGELKAFPLDAIIDVRTSEVPSNGNEAQQAAGFSVIVGNEEHRFDAATAQLRRDWITAMQNLRSVRNSQLTRDKERQAHKRDKENDEMRQIALSLQKSEERKASFYQERLRKRAEQRESLRAKYHLGTTTAS